MGCDIHAFAEKKVKGKWEFKGAVHIDRNYDLFSMLANVRNGYGFAGCKTGEGFNPISDPRGLPFLPSDGYLKEVDIWDGDGHSHSWLTLSELRNYDWGQMSIKEGVVSLDEYGRCESTGEKPTSWSGGISGRDIMVVECDEADKLLLDRSSITSQRVYVRYRWSIMYKDHASEFLENIIPELESMGSGDEVRLVFFFDN